MSGATAAALGVYVWQIEPEWLEFTQHTMPVAGLPEELRGRTLVHLSDLHAGRRVSDAYLTRTFERVRALTPAVVVYTGDFTDYHDDVYAQAERVYRDAPRGTVGTVGILGNHDYGPGWSRPEVADRIADLLASAGIHVLRNEVADAGGLQVVGMDDLWAGRFAPRRALGAVERSRPAIVLSHNPDTADHPVWDGFEGWILAGHTHGGQCRPPFLPPPLLPVRNRRYTAGEFALDGNLRLYVSRGVGHTLRVRFNVRPEVTLFELQPA